MFPIEENLSQIISQAGPEQNKTSVKRMNEVAKLTYRPVSPDACLFKKENR